MAVVEAVAEARDEDPLRLPILAKSIDPDALDRLFLPPVRGTSSVRGGYVRFRYDGFCVTVRNDGVIAVRSAEDG